MKMRFVAGVLLSSLMLAGVVAPVQAKHAAAPTAPGRYEDWGPDIDVVEIARTFILSDYDRVEVEPLATDGVALPPADENTYEPVKAMLGRFTTVFAEGLREAPAKPVEVIETAAPAARVLRLRGKVLLLDPGSRAKRYWGGFGAGAVRVEVRCELVDGASGDVLLSFTQQRRSGFGGFGGSYEELMARTIRQIGGDVANLLKQF
ncbi:DUF4410 domain-containing protein [Dokdonella fugitiva]|uniref:Uncharacterized protein DUF3313 n=1 Tax=Dokdonella fugitiva TaxID=328517 RepID=A0A4R2I8K0_9GAMM|nr:DUF4410 domain-containing protein [Dokdonella fugitiva]MBA8884302.1 hypothetical protein [Dokdonella fugitiva]TCO39909.1 uncharacterized protein DUF3313 [Dokdonella fugitiva]